MTEKRQKILAYGAVVIGCIAVTIGTGVLIDIKSAVACTIMLTLCSIYCLGKWGERKKEKMWMGAGGFTAQTTMLLGYLYALRLPDLAEEWYKKRTTIIKNGKIFEEEDDAEKAKEIIAFLEKRVEQMLDEIVIPGSPNSWALNRIRLHIESLEKTETEE